MTYIKVSRTHSYLMLDIRNWLGQLMVTLFLFYSGYGIYESIKKRKDKYVDTIPKNRCLKTFFHYAIAITIFLLLDYYIGKTFPIKTIILAYLAWAPIGASNWYIFAIIALYIITYLSFKVFDKNDRYAIRLTWIVSIIMIYWLSLYRPAYCYNTMLCYTFGLSYSYYKKDIEKFFFNNNTKYVICIILTLFSVITLKKMLYMDICIMNFYRLPL